MKTQKLYLLLVLACLAFHESSAQTFATAHDTVFAYAYTCPVANLYDSVIVPVNDTVHIRWQVIASNFPPDWYTQTALGINDAYLFRSNLNNQLWNGTSGDSFLVTYTLMLPVYYMSLDMSSTTTAGTYWMKIQLKDTVTSYTKNIVYVVTRIPFPLLPNAGTVAGPSFICMPDSIRLYDTTGLSGTWSVTNGHAGISPGTDSIVVRALSPGVDTIKYSVTNSCGTNTYAKTILISAGTDSGVITGGQTLCVGSTLVLKDTATGGVWTSSNNNVFLLPSADSITLMGMHAGTDTIIYTNVNGCGISTSTKVVQINPGVSAGTITGGTSLCLGSTLLLADTTSGGTWSATNGTATVSGGLVTTNIAGVDTIVYTCTSSCGNTVSVTHPVTVHNLPAPVIIVSGATLGTTVLYASYQWYLSGAPIANATGATFTPPTSGYYTVTVTDTNGCTASSSQFFALGLSVPEIETATNNVAVYPNPATTFISVTSGTQLNDVTIVDVLGRILYTQTCKASHLSIDIAGFSKGMYLLKVNGQYVKEWVKE